MEPNTLFSTLSLLFTGKESLLLRLLIAHFLTDFVLQTDSLVQSRFKKRWSSSWLYVHGVIAGGLVYVFGGLWHALWLPCAIFITHTIIDGVRASFKNTTRSLVIDQMAHTIIIFSCWSVAQGEVGQEIMSTAESWPSGRDVWAPVCGLADSSASSP